MCADTNASLAKGNESEPCELLVLIAPSHFQASAGDILNISYLVVNKCDYTLMNASLKTEETGPVLLNSSILLPGKAYVGIESMLLNDSDFPGPIIRTVEVSTKDPVGNRITQKNSTSIEL